METEDRNEHDSMVTTDNSLSKTYISFPNPVAQYE